MAPDSKNEKGEKGGKGGHPYKREDGKGQTTFNPHRYCNKCGKCVLGFVSNKLSCCGSCGENLLAPMVGMIECKRCRNLVKGKFFIF